MPENLNIYIYIYIYVYTEHILMLQPMYVPDTCMPSQDMDLLVTALEAGWLRHSSSFGNSAASDLVKDAP